MCICACADVHLPLGAAIEINVFVCGRKPSEKGLIFNDLLITQISQTFAGIPAICEVALKQPFKLVTEWFRSLLNDNSLHIFLHFPTCFLMFHLVSPQFHWSSPMFPLVFLLVFYFTSYESFILNGHVPCQAKQI